VSVNNSSVHLIKVLKLAEATVLTNSKVKKIESYRKYKSAALTGVGIMYVGIICCYVLKPVYVTCFFFLYQEVGAYSESF
jgi:hypothetical protein